MMHARKKVSKSGQNMTRTRSNGPIKRGGNSNMAHFTSWFHLMATKHKFQLTCGKLGKRCDSTNQRRDTESPIDEDPKLLWAGWKWQSKSRSRHGW